MHAERKLELKRGVLADLMSEMKQASFKKKHKPEVEPEQVNHEDEPLEAEAEHHDIDDHAPERSDEYDEDSEQTEEAAENGDDKPELHEVLEEAKENAPSMSAATRRLERRKLMAK